jgi:hypothetical protein
MVSEYLPGVCYRFAGRKADLAGIARLHGSIVTAATIAPV